MTDFVLVPGACHGSWWFDDVVVALERQGHRVAAVTLAGLEHTPEIDRLITLDTHIDQVREAVHSLGRDPVVLVGHSYAGSVITGVADAMPDRVAALVYLDAFIPDNGDSCWSMTNSEQRDWYINGARRTGYGVDPLPFFDERARPHPIATLLQRISLTGDWRQVRMKIHVTALGWPGESPMAGASRRAGHDPEFRTYEWDTPHNVMSDGPDRVVDLLHDL